MEKTEKKVPYSKRLEGEPCRWFQRNSAEIKLGSSLGPGDHIGGLVLLKCLPRNVFLGICAGIWTFLRVVFKAKFSTASPRCTEDNRIVDAGRWLQKSIFKICVA